MKKLFETYNDTLLACYFLFVVTYDDYWVILISECFTMFDQKKTGLAGKLYNVDESDGMWDIGLTFFGELLDA